MRKKIFILHDVSVYLVKNIFTADIPLSMYIIYCTKIHPYVMVIP